MTPGRVFGDQLEGADRLAPLTTEVAGRDQPTQRRPTVLALGQNHDPGMSRVDAGPTAYRTLPRTRSGTHQTGGPSPREQPRGAEREINPEHRSDPGHQACLGELHRAVDTVAIGEREAVLAQLGSALHQGLRVAGAVAQRIAGGHVQVDERVGGHRAGVGD